jgi:hypothetical protein
MFEQKSHLLRVKHELDGEYGSTDSDIEELGAKVF